MVNISHGVYLYSNTKRANLVEQLLTLQIMGAKQGHKDRKYNPNNKEEVRKIKDYIKAKIKAGWKLYGMKAGEKEMVEISEFPNKIDDAKLNRFILAGHDQVLKKAMFAPNAGG